MDGLGGSMKKLFLVLAVCLVGCKQTKQYAEYKTFEFCRDDGEHFIYNELYTTLLGYEYIGPLNNNGINCTRVLFGR